MAHEEKVSRNQYLIFRLELQTAAQRRLSGWLTQGKESSIRAARAGCVLKRGVPKGDSEASLSRQLRLLDWQNQDFKGQFHILETVCGSHYTLMRHLWSITESFANYARQTRSVKLWTDGEWIAAQEQQVSWSRAFPSGFTPRFPGR